MVNYMIFKKASLLVISTTLILGCADTHSIKNTSSYSNVKFESQSSVYIAMSKNGEYGEHYYGNSGKMVSQIIQSALSVKLNNIELASQPENYKVALENAASKQIDYLVYPTILHWEDRATEWSGKPDKVQVKISVVDVKSNSEVKSGVIDGKSGIWTFGGDHPQDLLPEPTQQFFQDLL